MEHGKQGRPTYNTLNARLLLQRWVPEALREELPPEPEKPEARTAAGRCFRQVSAILAGKGMGPVLPAPVAIRPTAAQTAHDLYSALYNLPAVRR